MSQIDTTPQDTDERARKVAEARAELLRMAEEQGARLATTFEELLGDPSEGDSEKEEVDDFLRSLREWRSTPSHRSIG